MTFGDLLRSYRERAGLTQEELGARAGISAEAISALERGERRNPYAHTARTLAEALRLSTDKAAALLGERNAAPQADPPPAGDTRAASARLPIYLTPFVWREREIEELSNLIAAPGRRLITLCGAGGSARLAWPSRSRGAAPSSPTGWPSFRSPRSLIRC